MLTEDKMKLEFGIHISFDGTFPLLFDTKDYRYNEILQDKVSYPRDICNIELEK